MLTPELMILIVAGAQLPLLGLACVVEFSRRKAHPSPPREISPESAVEQRVELAPQPRAVTEAEVETGAPPSEIAAVTAPTAERPAEPQELAPEIVITEPEQIVPTAIEEALTPAEAPLEVETPVERPEPSPLSVEEEPPAPVRKPPRIGLGLRRTREHFLSRIRAAITGSTKLDEIYEGLEEALIGADVGVDTTMKIVEAVRARLKNDSRPDVIRDTLKGEIEQILVAVERPIKESDSAPLVIMLAGVNGAGKTTTVAKLAALLKDERGPVVVAASDTFRAAAIEQLQIWCERVGAELIKQKQGSDPAAVAFDAVKAAVARKASAVLIDTAGRLQTKVNLMEELKKIARVIGRELPGAPHEVWLVLDATTGQNALSQAKIFGEAAPLTGVVLAKLDSTAKGGVIIAIAERLKLPVRFVGLGEEVADLRPFDAHEFVNALFSDAEDGSDAASGTYAA
jgi:fused signal recognition particle receptor